MCAMMMVLRMVEQDWVQLASDWKNATLNRNENARKDHKKRKYFRLRNLSTKENKSD